MGEVVLLAREKSPKSHLFRYIIVEPRGVEACSLKQGVEFLRNLIVLHRTTGLRTRER